MPLVSPSLWTSLFAAECTLCICQFSPWGIDSVTVWHRSKLYFYIVVWYTVGACQLSIVLMPVLCQDSIWHGVVAVITRTMSRTWYPCPFYSNEFRNDDTFKRWQPAADLENPRVLCRAQLVTCYRYTSRSFFPFYIIISPEARENHVTSLSPYLYLRMTPKVSAIFHDIVRHILRVRNSDTLKPRMLYPSPIRKSTIKSMGADIWSRQ